MRFSRLVMGALLALLALPAIAAQGDDVVVYASPARFEIERILVADNLDTEALGPRIVANAIAGIARGRAPDDFWRAYQLHVRAWQQLADADDRARNVRDDPTSLEQRAAAVAIAERRIETSFDDVERIARRYGARLPAPLSQIKSTV